METQSTPQSCTSQFERMYTLFDSVFVYTNAFHEMFYNVFLLWNLCDFGIGAIWPSKHYLQYGIVGYGNNLAKNEIGKEISEGTTKTWA